MWSHLLTDTTGRIAAVILALALATAVKALASVRRTRIEQESRTRRLAISLEGSEPHQRPKIITACSHLEGGSAGGRGSDEPDPSAPSDGIEHA